jgi:hypothetical protein
MNQPVPSETFPILFCSRCGCEIDTCKDPAVYSYGRWYCGPCGFWKWRKTNKRRQSIRDAEEDSPSCCGCLIILAVFGSGCYLLSRVFAKIAEALF